MKRFTALFLLSLFACVIFAPSAWADVAINETNFPDANFRSYVSDFDTDKDGSLSDGEIAAVKESYVIDRGISSLKGIEYFTALTELYCYSNALTALDVSKNTDLTLLYCYKNQLTTLDVSNNTALTKLRCYSNQLTALDVSKNNALEYLDCNGNQLTELDIRNCPNLTLGNLTVDSTVRIIHGNMDGLPAFGNHSLVLSVQLGLDFYATIPEGTNTENAYTDFTINGKTGNPSMFSNAEEVDNNRRFTCYINSVQMADTITAKFCYNGDKGTAIQDYTVKEYLDTIINSTQATITESTGISATSADLLIALAKAIEDYGHYVQIPLSAYNGWTLGTDHATMDCVNENIDSDSAEVAEKLRKYALVKDIDGSGIEKLEYDLDLDSETALEIYLTPGEGAGTVKAFITDDDNEFDGKTNMAVYDSSANEYVITIGGISAHKLGKVYTVNITTSMGSTFTVKASALSYSDAVMQTSDDADLKRAVIALYKYYTATMAYRGEATD